jgi:hypothetical protein
MDGRGPLEEAPVTVFRGWDSTWFLLIEGLGELVKWTLALNEPELWVIVGGGVVTIVVMSAWLNLSGFGQVDRTGSWDASRLAEVVGWERERMLGAARGVASTAGGFLLTLVTLLLKDEIKVTLTGWSILGLVLGAVGSLVLAASLSARTRNLPMPKREGEVLFW